MESRQQDLNVILDTPTTEKQEQSNRNEPQRNNKKLNNQISESYKTNTNTRRNWYRDFKESYVWKENKITIAKNKLENSEDRNWKKLTNS